MLKQNNLIRVVRFQRYVLVRNCSGKSVPAESKLSDDDWFNTMAEGDFDERVVPKPISTLPDHLPQTRKRILQRPWWKYRYFVDVNTLPVEKQEYSERPEYPEIFPTGRAGINERIRRDWYSAIRRLPTAEQKLYEITKHYGHLTYMLEPVMTQYNILPIQQHITKTHLIHSLPESYTQTLDDQTVDEELKQVLLSTIANRLYAAKCYKPPVDFTRKRSSIGLPDRHCHEKSRAEDDILIDVVQSIRSYLQHKQQLPTVQIDHQPYVASSWWRNDCRIPFVKKKWFKEDRRDQAFVYNSTHSVHLRSELPLAEVVPLDHQLCTESKVPECDYNLLSMGFHLRRRNIIALPGFWLGKSEGFDFPTLLCLNREGLRLRNKRNKTDFADKQDVLDGMAILSSFAWLSSIVNNLGFTFYDQLTYPLVTQAIVTDGQHWSFYVYQLNSHSFYSDIVNENLNNLCWSSGDLKLFEKHENGVLHGVNEAVLKLLIKFVTANTVQEVEHDLRPYLGVDQRSQKEIDELSYSLRRKYANMVSQFVARRKKTNLWETIYKNHKDAPIDVKRTRPKIEFKYPPFFK